jgi:hypothetical protein
MAQHAEPAEQPRRADSVFGLIKSLLPRRSRPVRQPLFRSFPRDRL